MSITFTLDDKTLQAEEGNSVLHTAMKSGVEIPHVCFSPEIKPTESCRTCLVEDLDTGRISVSCTLLPREGMKLSTKTPMVTKGRHINLELLFAGHQDRCTDCKEGRWCKIATQCEKYGLDLKRFAPRVCPGEIEQFDGAPAIEFDPGLCINCKKCIDKCRSCAVGYLTEKGYGKDVTVGNHAGKIACIFCGQCTTVCPTGAIREVSSISKVEEALKDPSKYVIIQPAPSIRATLPEAWGEKFDETSVGKMYAALRALKPDKVFDVNFGADITTYVEAEDLANRIKTGGTLPMFTACCPAWVRYVETFQPQLIPHLTTARSPHIHSGGAYKTWWATQNNINPENIYVVSVLPCTSKNYEIHRRELFINDQNTPTIDATITTREFITMLKDRGIEWKDLKEDKADTLAEHSGAGAIYGASGGVMESALRSTYWQLTGKNMPKLEFKPVRGMDGLKKAEIEINGKTIRVGVCSTVRNVALALMELRKDPEAYHYIEVMACPGGCIGGGGQPTHEFPEELKTRQDCLYQIDDHKKIRTAHENPELIKYMKWLETQTAELKDSVLETHKYYNLRDSKK